MSELLQSKIAELEQLGIQTEICKKITGHIEESIPQHLFRISPYRLADDWSLDRDQVLNAFLYGTKNGIFDLEWDIKCPSCKGATSTTSTLKQLLSKSHCKYCQIDITGGFDDSVEVTFNVNPNIRKTEELDFYSIMKSWHVFEEGITLSPEAGETQELRLTLSPGSYHLSNPEKGLSCPLLITESGEEKERDIEYKYNGSSISRGNEWFGTGPVNITFKNDSEENLDFKFVKLKDQPWVSGAKVASNQIFRDYFSTELISADESFTVNNTVFIFTDIKGSTDLYERRGDSKAYYLVKEHFKIMTDKVRSNNGAIVKTIGDAIMATFTVSKDAINTVFEMHKAFDEFNLREDTSDDIVIKIGAHRGPCIAVTSNDRLDYFGRTVNIAARVQGLSGGGDIMLSKELFSEPSIAEQIQEFGWNTKPIKATLKGIEGLYEVVHITP
ncbi:MAG: DUF5939 domain-containing protein [SAR324 cluster bacterium]|nr:DUF5939 domain-containing protein [SAR324 cluster bacterium]